MGKAAGGTHHTCVALVAVRTPSREVHTAACTSMQMAKLLGFEAVAEGAQAEDETTWLKGPGCDLIQEYH